MCVQKQYEMVKLDAAQTKIMSDTSFKNVILKISVFFHKRPLANSPVA